MRALTCQIGALSNRVALDMDTPKVPLRAARPTFIDLFTRKLFTILREGYRRWDFQADAVVGRSES